MSDNAPPAHTAGRLTYREDFDYGFIIGSVDLDAPIAQMEIWSSDDPDLNDDVQRQNARRLVACWNACTALPTEALEANAVERLVGMVRRYRESYHPDTLYDEAGELLAQVAGQEGKTP